MVIVTATVSYVLTFNMANQSWKECRVEKPFYVYNQVFYYNDCTKRLNHIKKINIFNLYICSMKNKIKSVLKLLFEREIN